MPRRGRCAPTLNHRIQCKSHLSSAVSHSTVHWAEVPQLRILPVSSNTSHSSSRRGQISQMGALMLTLLHTAAVEYIINIKSVCLCVSNKIWIFFYKLGFISWHTDGKQYLFWPDRGSTISEFCEDRSRKPWTRQEAGQWEARLIRYL